MIILYSSNIKNDVIELDKNESHHCINVMRKKVDDRVIVIDGKGNSCTCTITDIKKNIVLLMVIKRSQLQKKINNLHIGIAPTKSQDRLEWFIEKAVEIGVEEITFLKTKRTERRKINIHRCIKISISAMKQSGQLYLPKLNDITDYTAFIDGCSEESLYIGSLQGNDSKRYFYDSYQNGTKCCFLIGPEGDFTADEIEQALEKNFIPVSLGKNILRTETAGVFVASAFKMLNEHD